MISQIQKSLDTFKTFDLNDNQTLELEIRLGKYRNGNFIPGLPEISFKQLLVDYKWDDPIIINETIFRNIAEKQRKNIGWILKDPLNKHDNLDDQTRVALNLETIYTFSEVIERHGATNDSFSKDKIQMFRKKTRYSRKVGHWQIDLTKVNVYTIQNNELTLDKTVYECEIELVDWESEALESFQDAWFSVSKYHYGSMVFPFYKKLTNSFKFIGNQPKTLEKENMHMLSKDYMVTDKIDGQRMFLISTQKGIFLLDSKMHAYRSPIQIPQGTILDGEYYKDTFLAFDCLFYKGQDIRHKHLSERLEPISSMKVGCKTFVDIKESNTLWEQIKHKDVDGLIFTPKYQDYNGNILKWKPNHTMDVYLDKQGEIYAWSGKEKKNIPISSFFKPTTVVKTLDILPPKELNVISELEYDPIDEVWIVQRVRRDKTRPNAVLTVCGVIKAITEDIQISDILNFLESSYNTPGKSYQQRQKTVDITYRKFHNKVKNMLIHYPEQRERKTLLDFGCGKGGDIMKWINAGYTDVLAIDNSHTHLYGPNGFSDRYEKVKDKINITFVWGNVLGPLKECGMNDIEKDKLKPWLKTKFDIISCQFAIHYFLNTKDEWTMMVKNIQKFLKPNGYFVGTYLNGHQLMDLDKETIFKINDQPFYTLKHNGIVYNEFNQKNLVNRCTAFWKIPRQKLTIQTIEWNEPIGENILFPNHLEMLLTKGNLKKVEDKSFQTLFAEYQPNLSPDELVLSSLHNYFIYKF